MKTNSVSGLLALLILVSIMIGCAGCKNFRPAIDTNLDIGGYGIHIVAGQIETNAAPIVAE